MASDVEQGAPRGQGPPSSKPFVAIGLIALCVLGVLWWQVFDRHAARTASALESWLDLEAEIVENAARAAREWLVERTTTDDVSVRQAEQEVLALFIAPIRLGELGDAWVYNQDSVVFDGSSDFPSEYAGLSVEQVFARQKERGASHYEEIVNAVKNATTGTAWYIWLPEKGREYTAWTSVRVGADTWTIGLSTPEHEILSIFGVERTFERELIMLGLISALMIGFVVTLALKQRADAERLAILNESNARLEQAVRERTERLETMNSELKRSNEDLEQFAYATSHDLQAPLRTISNFLGLLRVRYGDRLDAEANEFIAYSEDGAKRLSRQISGLLDYSRTSTKRQAQRPVALADILADAMANLRGTIEETGAHILLPDPGPTVLVDRGQLALLMQNLIGNAIKYHHPDRSPDIRINAVPEGTRWRIDVADNGIGIPQEFHDRVFGVFQRLHGPDTFEGTGIGLALVKRIAENHGSRVTLRSDGRSGSVFSFSLAGVAEPADGPQGPSASPVP
ncbi:hypothetical protein F1188_14290 [Roseospira marina]|uniref:histidine kinase n=1 Tax=Roseospira marina TaxID=140057 RepID=A0A5M6IAN7_9PROT|nr:ATP-binding protein [Roseospira marina]KAA5604779.1 hypothetical protein F1188_14290 [Roseospira marina]MBB4313463.1 signal transduction histidine kinase [Roseospira marina]MBB5086625.1 signal transduction histidine kinase [Roseospira marina]